MANFHFDILNKKDTESVLTLLLLLCSWLYIQSVLIWSVQCQDTESLMISDHSDLIYCRFFDHFGLFIIRPCDLQILGTMEPEELKSGTKLRN